MASPYWTNHATATLYHADAREIPLPDASVHCVVTSPPYWGLRDYGLGTWRGGDAECGHERPLEMNPGTGFTAGTFSPEHMSKSQRPWHDGECGHCGAVQEPAGIGTEPTLAEHIDNLVAVFREVRRVLRDDGTVWLNYGDAYANSAPRGTFGDQGDLSTGAHGELAPKRNLAGLPPPKNLIGLPWRVAFALQDDGWWIRSAIVWHKPNPMPESVRDRPTNAYEMVFLLAKQQRYFMDMEAIREPNSDWTIERAKYPKIGQPRRDPSVSDSGMLAYDAMRNGPNGVLNGANARNVWTIPTQGRPDAHFATFPDELPRRCILAGTSEQGVCAECGAHRERVVEARTAGGPTVGRGRNGDRNDAGMGGFYGASATTLGFRPTCSCDAGTVPGTVLDPFVGSGTTVAVAQSLGRRGIGLDLNTEYLDIAARRIGAVPLPLGI